MRGSRQKPFSRFGRRVFLRLRSGAGRGRLHGGACPFNPFSNDEELPASKPVDFGADPPWLEEAACVNSFTVQMGNRAAGQAAHVRAVLLNAGIPCHITTRESSYEATEAGSWFGYEVMVPGDLHLIATSVLEREIYNPEAEELWRVHLGDLSDNQLLALNETALVGGLVDRIARMKRAYAAEVARRGLSAKPWTV